MMKNSEALYTLKSALELQDDLSVAIFKNIINLFKEFIDDEKILSAIERKNWSETLVLIDNALLIQTKFKPYFFLSDLETFDFEEENGLTIDVIKELLSIELLQFCAVKDFSGNIASYCQHWENQRRICVAIDIDLINKLKQDRNVPLTLYKKVVKAKLGYYYRFTIKESFEYHNDDYDNNYDYEYGSKAYGYDSWDDMAFGEAFEGNIDAWRHYNE